MTAQPSLVLASLALLLTACDSGSEPAPAAPTTHESSKHEDHASENHREDHSNSGEHSEHESDD